MCRLLSSEKFFCICRKGNVAIAESFFTVAWEAGRVRLIDQTRLPWEEVYLELSRAEEVAQAIREMRVRGAPAIGVAAALGLALGAQQIDAEDKDTFLSQFEALCQLFAGTRPTAVNLFWAIQRMKQVAQQEGQVDGLKRALLTEALAMAVEDEEQNRRLGRYGAELIEDGFTILTHCNAGALATVAYGTALGVVRAAWEQGKRIQVFASETRPRLQGAWLTAWELTREGIPVTVIADTMAGHFLQRGKINCVLVGADRIAANGDVANKIGTYQVAVLAKENGITFYVAAPTSTVDLSMPSGEHIPIEERPGQEVTHVRGVRIVPEGVGVVNPAFDVTPHGYVSAIITEWGVLREPYKERLREMVRASCHAR